MTPHNRGGSDLGAEDAVIRTIVAIVIIAVILGIGFSRGCVRDQPKADWNKPPDGWARGSPWEEDPKVRAERLRQEEEARRKFAEESTKFYQKMDERERQVRALTGEDKYPDAVALLGVLGRDHYADAERFGLTARLQTVQREVVRAACRLAKLKAVRLIGQDKYRAAAKVIDDLYDDVGAHASRVGLLQELDDLRHAYQFVKDLAKAADVDDAK
jgi:hypothetical protein